MFRRIRCEWTLTATLVAVGCTTRSTPEGPPRLLMGSGTGTVVTRSPDGAVTRDASLQLAIDPLPGVSTDGFALPLLSPDGSRLAWQGLSNADWPTLLAQPDATRSPRAEVHGRELASDAGWTRPEPLLLGRMASEAGVLVEAPQADGSRWIGVVPWNGAEPVWLVRDASVNAFAALGPRGERAWCRRATGADAFDLVVERPEGRLEWPRREGESWMMPVVADDGVYACSLRDGVLEIAFLPLRRGMTMTRSEAEPAILRKRISLRGTPRMAYQAFTACTADACATPAGLLFFHPDLRRMAIWDPRGDTMRLLAERSIAAFLQPQGGALVSLPDRLVMQETPPEPGLAPLQLIPGLWIVRGRDAKGLVMVGPSRESCQVSRLRVGADGRKP